MQVELATATTAITKTSQETAIHVSTYPGDPTKKNAETLPKIDSSVAGYNCGNFRNSLENIHVCTYICLAVNCSTQQKHIIQRKYRTKKNEK